MYLDVWVEEGSISLVIVLCLYMCLTSTIHNGQIHMCIHTHVHAHMYMLHTYICYQPPAVFCSLLSTPSPFSWSGLTSVATILSSGSVRISTK